MPIAERQHEQDVHLLNNNNKKIYGEEILQKKIKHLPVFIKIYVNEITEPYLCSFYNPICFF